MRVTVLLSLLILSIIKMAVIAFIMCKMLDYQWWAISHMNYLFETKASRKEFIWLFIQDIAVLGMAIFVLYYILRFV